MMLTGIIRKGNEPGWAASCDAVGVYTQGASRADAVAELASAIEVLVGLEGFKATVTEGRATGEDEYEVVVDSNQPEALAATALRQQRDYERGRGR